jgi:ABC-type multidrug transport system permease subunit
MVEELDHYFRILEKRLVVLTLWIFVSFLSVLFIGFGFLFVLVDIGGVSRGVACLCGGLLGFIVLFLGSHFTKESREKT